MGVWKGSIVSLLAPLNPQSQVALHSARLLQDWGETTGKKEVKEFIFWNIIEHLFKYAVIFPIFICI